MSKVPQFSCPESPQIAWHWGLVYVECPLAPNERDMGSCKKCHLNDTPKNNNSSDFKPKRRKTKSPIPSIGKTYNS